MNKTEKYIRQCAAVLQAAKKWKNAYDFSSSEPLDEAESRLFKAVEKLEEIINL